MKDLAWLRRDECSTEWTLRSVLLFTSLSARIAGEAIWRQHSEQGIKHRRQIYLHCHGCNYFIEVEAFARPPRRRIRIREKMFSVNLHGGVLLITIFSCLFMSWQVFPCLGASRMLSVCCATPGPDETYRGIQVAIIALALRPNIITL